MPGVQCNGQSAPMMMQYLQAAMARQNCRHGLDNFTAANPSEKSGLFIQYC